MFKSALFRLTFWYMVIIIGLCIIFSSVIYHESSNELSSGLQNQFRRIEIDINGHEINRRSIAMPISTDVELSLRLHRLFVNLVYFNILVGIGAGFGSYALAKRNIRPIEEAHNRQARFTSDVSHELRTPLASMKTGIEVALLDKMITNEDIKEQLNSNLQEVNRMEGLINNLLRISKLEKVDLQKSFVKVDLDKVVNEAIKINKNRLDKKDLEVKLNTRPIYTFGNEDNLVQVINILLDNAIKYSEPNKIIEITLKKKNFSQVIEIKDQGIGIAAKDMPYVFDRFYRTEQSRSKLVSDSGYGLGLPLAKYLVELHNGSINISSKNNNGTKVSINLPSMK